MTIIEKYIHAFLNNINNSGHIELYNEAGLQFELAFYLKEKLGSNYLINLERNIKHFGGKKINIPFKREMDIFIKKGNKKYCIELKFPLARAIPKRTYQALKDIAFLEQLKHIGFSACYSILITSQPNYFRCDLKNDGIYKFMRKHRLMYQPKKTEVDTYIDKRAKFSNLKISGKYQIDLKELDNYGRHYYYYYLTI